MANFLLSSAGRRGALTKIVQGVAAGLGGGDVIAVDSSPLSAAGYLADHFELVPRVTEHAFVDSVLACAQRHDVQVIIPTIDPEIAVYAANRSQFEAAGMSVWVSAPDVAMLGWDKWVLAQWLGAGGFRTVRTLEVTDPAVTELTGRVVAKPRCGSSSVGVIIADSVAELNLQALTPDYIVQEAAEGVEFTVDFAVDRSGVLLGMVPRQRLEVRAGEVSKGRTIAVPEVECAVGALVAALPGAYGVLNAQLLFDVDTGVVNIIEINPRFGGGYPLTHAAGADFVSALWRADSGEAVDVSWESGMTMLRYDDAVFLPATQMGLHDPR